MKRDVSSHYPFVIYKPLCRSYAFRVMSFVDSPQDSTPQRFQPTRWSIVLRARGEGREARQALEDLCRMYWFPLYTWCRSRGYPAADSEDYIQGFFLQVIEKKLFDRAEEARGKLRTFLLTALQRHIRDEREKIDTERRGGGQVISIDPAEAEAHYAGSLISGESPEQAYDRQWALTVLDRAVETLAREHAARGKSAIFSQLRPFLTDEGDSESYAAAAAELGMSAGAFKVAVHRLRTRFRETLRIVVRDTQPDDSDVDSEIAYLAGVLAGN